MPPTTVSVLGTGTMGAPIAINLAKHGFSVRGWNRTRSRAEPLADHGVVVADTPAEAVRGADVVITMLGDGASVAETIAEAQADLSPDAVWIQTSTVGVPATERLAKLAERFAVEFVDAPVLGTKQPAEQGKLVVLAAGPSDVRDRVQPVFDAIGQRTLWVGDSGAGAAASRLKLVANSWVLAITAAVGEAVSLAEGLGVDPQLLLDAVTGTAVDSTYLQMKGRAIIARDFTPSFSTVNAAKDAGLVTQGAVLGGVMLDVAEAAGARLRRAITLGHGDEDMAAAYFASWPGGHRD